MKRTLPLALIALAATLAPAEEGAEKITLAVRTEAGRKTKTARRLTINVSGSLDQMGQKMDFDLEQTIVHEYEEEVVAATGGVPTKLKRSYTKHDTDVTQSMSGMGEPRTQSIRGAVAGKTVTLEAREGNWAVDPQEHAELFKTEKPGRQAGADFLPDGPVAVGESWTRTGADAVSTLSIFDTGALKCTLTEVKEQGGRKIAHIAVAIDGKGQSQGGPISMKLQGHVYFDIAAGHMIETFLKGPMTLASQAGELTGDAVIRLTSRMVQPVK